MRTISKDKAEALLLQYIEILKNSFEKQMTFNPLDYTCGTLLSVLKNMKITSASVGERIYTDYKHDSPYAYSDSRRRYDTFELKNYGHTVLIVLEPTEFLLRIAIKLKIIVTPLASAFYSY